MRWHSTRMFFTRPRCDARCGIRANSAPSMSSLRRSMSRARYRARSTVGTSSDGAVGPVTSREPSFPSITHGARPSEVQTAASTMATSLAPLRARLRRSSGTNSGSGSNAVICRAGMLPLEVQAGIADVCAAVEYDGPIAVRDEVVHASVEDLVDERHQRVRRRVHGSHRASWPGRGRMNQPHGRSGVRIRQRGRRVQ